MGLIAPRDQGYVGGLTKLRFDQQVSQLNLTINDVHFHAEEGDAGPADTFSVDLNSTAPDTELKIVVSYRKGDGTTYSTGDVAALLF